MNNLTGLSPDPALVRERPGAVVDNCINHGARVHGCVTDRPTTDARAEAINLKDHSSASLKLADLMRGSGRHHLPLVARLPEPGARPEQRSAMLQWAEDVSDACLGGWLNAGGQIRATCHDARRVPSHAGFEADVLCADVAAEQVR